MTAQKRPEFTPSTKQLMYKRALVEALLARQKPTDESVSRQIGLRRKTISDWRHNSAFRAWLDDDLFAEARGRVGRILLAFCALAEAGSVPHAQIVLEHCGFTGVLAPGNTLGQPGQPPPGPQVIINLPSAPDELAGHSVVTGMFKLVGQTQSSPVGRTS